MEDSDIGLVQRAHRQPVRASCSRWERLLEQVLPRLVGEKRDGPVLVDLSGHGVKVADESVADQGGGESKLAPQLDSLEGVAYVRRGKDEGHGLDPYALNTPKDVC